MAVARAAIAASAFRSVACGADTTAMSGRRAGAADGHGPGRTWRGLPAWQGYLLAAGVVAVAYYATGSDAARLVLYNGLGLSSVVATLVGVGRYRPRDRAPWLLFAAGRLSFVIADVIFYAYDNILHVERFPSVADGFYLACYPLLVAGLLLLIRRRSAGHDRAALVDAAIITTGVALLAWEFLIVPYVRDPALTLPERLVSIAYPLADILLLAVVVRLAVGAGSRPAAYRLLAASVIALLLVDAVYAWLSLTSGYHTGSPIDVGWMAFYALWGAAALHPSMTRLAVVAPLPPPTLGRWRLILLAGAALMAPTMLAVQAVRHQPIDVAVLVAGSAALFLLVVARVQGLVTLLAQALATVEHQARHDGLTGLANRAVFTERVDHALARTRHASGQVAVLFIDLDGFKQVNDTLGHAAGDQLLVQVAQRLRLSLRPGDTVARLGGDEFTIILDGVPERAAAGQIADRVLTALAQPFALDEARVTCGASIGIALTSGPLDQADSLLRRADHAMYTIKRAGKGQIAWADPTPVSDATAART
jgi:diguanylate cyclase (GGDEF)-like protein